MDSADEFVCGMASSHIDGLSDAGAMVLQCFGLPWTSRYGNEAASIANTLGITGDTTFAFSRKDKNALRSAIVLRPLRRHEKT